MANLRDLKKSMSLFDKRKNEEAHKSADKTIESESERKSVRSL